MSRVGKQLACSMWNRAHARFVPNRLYPFRPELAICESPKSRPGVGTPEILQDIPEDYLRKRGEGQGLRALYGERGS